MGNTSHGHYSSIPDSEMDKEVFMEIPEGMRTEETNGKVCRLNKVYTVCINQAGFGTNI